MKPWIRWSVFTLWLGVIFAVAPTANQIQKWIADHLGKRALVVLLSILLVVALAAFTARLARSRVRSGPGRLAWVLGLSGLALAVMWRLEVAAEPAHLVSYGILGALAFWALSAHHGDHGVYLAAAMLTALAGTAEEGFQWLLPKRYWDLGDIGLNVTAGLLAQLVIWKGVRPRLTPGIGARSLRLTARLALCVVVLLGLYFANTPQRIEWYATRLPGLGFLAKGGPGPLMIEYGHRYEDPEIGGFRSRMTPEALRLNDRERGAEMGPHLARFLDTTKYGGLQLGYRPSRTPLVYEAGGHLFYRQRLWQRVRETTDPAEKRHLATQALRENLILERYFPHILAASSATLSPRDRQRMQALHEPEAAFESEVSNWLFTCLDENRLRLVLLAILAVLGVVDRKCSLSLRRDQASSLDRTSSP